MRNSYKILGRRSKWKTALQRLKHRLENNININVKEREFENVD
jgi:hypothetical protein